jgi:hypothetical protein
MNRLLSPALILLLMADCQNTKDVELDTSQLEKIKMEDVSEEEENNIPITYQAPSVKVGLEALPFEMNLPEKLPFDATSFHPPVINDSTHDGKKVWVEFTANSKKPEDNIQLRISAFNDEFLERNQEAEKINLKKEIIGYYHQKMINFHYMGVSYTIVYINDTISMDQHKKEIVDLANQILK